MTTLYHHNLSTGKTNLIRIAVVQATNAATPGTFSLLRRTRQLVIQAGFPFTSPIEKLPRGQRPPISQSARPAGQRPG